FVAHALNRLALLGQLIHDLHAGLYRWRQIMPVALSLEQIGPENPETVGARQIVARKQVRLKRDERLPRGLRMLAGQGQDRAAGVLPDSGGPKPGGQGSC